MGTHIKYGSFSKRESSGKTVTQYVNVSNGKLSTKLLLKYAGTYKKTRRYRLVTEDGSVCLWRGYSDNVIDMEALCKDIFQDIATVFDPNQNLCVCGITEMLERIGEPVYSIDDVLPWINHYKKIVSTVVNLVDVLGVEKVGVLVEALGGN